MLVFRNGRPRRGKEAELVKVTDFADIAAYGVMSTPGLVIDEKLVSAGKVLTAAEIGDILNRL